MSYLGLGGQLSKAPIGAQTKSSTTNSAAGGNKTTAANNNNTKFNFGTGTGFSFGSNFGFGSKQENQVDPILQRLHKIRDTYNKNNASFRFYHIAYNVSSGSGMGSAAKPASIDQSEWDKYVAIAKNYFMVSKDSMVPTQICGFEELEKRCQAQNDIVNKMVSKLEDLKSRIAQLKKIHDDQFMKLLDEITEKSHLISEQLMEVLEYKEINALPDYPFSQKEHELYDRLQKLKNEINKPNQYTSALNSLELKALMITESAANDNIVELPKNIDEIEAIIQANHNAIEALVKILNNMNKSTSTFESTLKGSLDEK